MSYLKTLNFPRVVILLSFAGSGVLGWLVYDSGQRLDQILNDELPRVPALVTEIQQLGIELESYQELVASSGTPDDFDLQPYIREIAATPGTVEVGQLSINVPTPRRFGREGGIDRLYKFEPAGETQSYSRGKIANFLYKLEAENRRVKVTSLSLTPFNRRSRLKPGEVGDDLWTFKAEITYRTKE